LALNGRLTHQGVAPFRKGPRMNCRRAPPSLTNNIDRDEANVCIGSTLPFQPARRNWLNLAESGRRASPVGALNPAPSTRQTSSRCRHRRRRRDRRSP
jgi:hypothetical protein